jgi:hypothetical protein
MTRRTTTVIAASVWTASGILVAITLLLIAWSRDVQVPAGFDTAAVVETVRYLAATTVGPSWSRDDPATASAGWSWR